MNKPIVPLFCTDKLETTRAFYQLHLDFHVALEMPGYVELEKGGEGGSRIGFMAPDGEKWSAADGRGLIYCFAVDDADAEHARLVGEGIPILEQPEDKPWGERGFIATDPNGIALYFGHALPGPPQGTGNSARVESSPVAG